MFECGCGEAEPVGAHAESDFIGADFDYGVLRGVEPVGGCVGAEQGSPGGPEFGVEAIVHDELRAKLWDVNEEKICQDCVH